MRTQVLKTFGPHPALQNRTAAASIFTWSSKQTRLSRSKAEFTCREIVSLDEILFNNLMGRLEVPFQYHKILRNAIRSKMAPSPGLSPWLPIDNREEVWRTLRMLGNIGGHQDASASQHGSPAAPTTGYVSIRGTRSNHSSVPTTLSDDYPTHKLDGARQFYPGRTESVPFLLQKRWTESKYVVIPTLGMKRPISRQKRSFGCESGTLILSSGLWISTQ